MLAGETLFGRSRPPGHRVTRSCKKWFLHVHPVGGDTNTGRVDVNNQTNQTH